MTVFEYLDVDADILVDGLYTPPQAIRRFEGYQASRGRFSTWLLELNAI
jgi:hypothetical protein